MVGNRIQMRLFDQDSTSTTDITWNLTINHLNQMTQRYQGTWADGPVGEIRMTYAYDANGNLIEYGEYEHQGSNTWTEELKWVYTWNVRDQLTLAMRWDDGLADNSGSVAYE